MIRNIFGVIFLCLSGLFMMMIGIFTFVDIPELGGSKYLIIGIYGVLLLICHVIGVLLFKATNWKVSTGITLLVATAINVLTLITIIATIDLFKSVEGLDSNGLYLESLNIFSVNIFSLLFMGFCIVLGIYLYRSGKKMTLNKTDFKNKEIV